MLGLGIFRSLVEGIGKIAENAGNMLVLANENRPSLRGLISPVTLLAADGVGAAVSNSAFKDFFNANPLKGGK